MKKLIGSDGAVFSGTWGAQASSGTTLTAGTFYRVDQLDSSSALPAGTAVGYMYRADGTETLAADDLATPFSASPLCDVQSWNMESSKGEIPVTTFCSGNQEFRASKYDDISGTMEGIMTTGVTDLENGIQNKFFTIVKQETGSYSIYPKDESELLAMLYTDDTDESGEYIGYYFLPVVLTSFSASASTGDEPQTFSSSFRPGTSDVGVVYYSVENA
jgi:hypothetical protein